jgi:DNA-binding transcriptional regulator YhcF (GntR family)
VSVDPVLDVRIEAAASTPPFEQLRTHLARCVAEGRLPAGTRLPTVRSLAQGLGLAAGTVARAYKELEADGVVETHGRRGTFVTSAALADVDGGGPGGVDSTVVEAATALATAARRHGLTLVEAQRLVEAAWG